MSLVCNGGGKYVEEGTFVKKGTTIIEAEAFAAVLNSKFRTKRCDACFESCKVHRCSGCAYVYYCSRNCQRKSWSVHKIECPNTKRIYPRELPDLARMMARIIIKLQNGKGEERGYYSSQEYRTWKDLMTHYCNIKQDMKKMDHFTCLTAVLNEFLPDSMLLAPKEMLELYGRISINSFDILDSKMSSIGFGLYLGPSIIDHSCKPNAVTVFDGTTMIVRSLQDISSFHWKKVSISYIDVLNSVEGRREELQNNYYFRCYCDGCERSEATAAAAACPNKACPNPCFLSDLKCGKCGHELAAEYMDDFETVSADSLRHFKRMKNNPKLEVCRLCLKQQEGLLHPLNMLHIRILEMGLIAACKAEMWDECEIYATKLAPKFKYYYGDSHPLTANMYLTLGCVLAYGKKPQQALDAIRECRDMVKLAFGENHPKMIEVKIIVAWVVTECKLTTSDKLRYSAILEILEV